MAKEAKKDPQELTVEQKLKALFQLQTMLSKIDEIKTLRGELPLEVQDLDIMRLKQQKRRNFPAFLKLTRIQGF